MTDPLTSPTLKRLDDDFDRAVETAFWDEQRNIANDTSWRTHPSQQIQQASPESMAALNRLLGYPAYWENTLPDPYPMGRNRRLEHVANGR